MPSDVIIPRYTLSVAMSGSEVGNGEMLRRIADAIGQPVERFFIDQARLDTAVTTDEYLLLWSKIATEEGKRQAIEALRVIVEMEQR